MLETNGYFFFYYAAKIKLTLSKAVKAKPELVPSLLTLALNDAMTYDKVRLHFILFIHHSSVIAQLLKNSINLCRLQNLVEPMDPYGSGTCFS